MADQKTTIRKNHAKNLSERRWNRRQCMLKT